MDKTIKVGELDIQVKQFSTVKEAAAWFRNTNYRWYTNTIKDVSKSLDGLKTVLDMSNNDFKKYASSDKIMLGKSGKTYLVYYKEIV